MRFTLSISFVLICMSVFSQDLSIHQWKDRLLIIEDYSESRKQSAEQLELLDRVSGDVEERKLKIYLITGEGYRFWPDLSTTWTPTSKEWRKKGSGEFKISLVGLDGGIKLSEERTISTDRIFQLIDSMPMRRWEIDKKN